MKVLGVVPFVPPFRSLSPFRLLPFPSLPSFLVRLDSFALTATARIFTNRRRARSRSVQRVSVVGVAMEVGLESASYVQTRRSVFPELSPRVAWMLLLRCSRCWARGLRQKKGGGGKRHSLLAARRSRF